MSALRRDPWRVAHAVAAVVLTAVTTAASTPALAAPVTGRPVTGRPVTGRPTVASFRAGYGVAADRCTLADPRLAGVSGLATSGGVLYAATDQPPVRVLAIEAGCRVGAATRVTVPAAADAASAIPGGGTDIEDLATGPDGSLWLADIGGDRAPRAGVSLLRWPGRGPTVTRYDLRYPDGPHDAAALLVSLLDQVLIVTKSDKGGAGVYLAPRPLRTAGTLTKVATLDVASIRPAGQTGAPSVQVTGGAVAPDGIHVALRTYLAAFEWDAPDGDLVAALRSRPRAVALGPDHQGEAIAYAPDGRALITAGAAVPGALRELPIQRTPEPPTGSAPVLTPATVAGAFAALVLAALLLAFGRERRRWATRATTYQAG